MKILVVTRHTATCNWLKTRLAEHDLHFTAHFTAEMTEGFEVVVGILPINLVADLNARGIRFFMVTMEVPAELRGKELTEEQMVECNVKLEQFCVLRDSTTL